jgi:putative membrane-bound dehydrogenase-like protein
MRILILAWSFASLLTAAPLSLFDGKSLAGWEIPAGEEKWWQVRDGMIVGGSLDEKITNNLFLSSTRGFQNFDLKFKIRIVKGEGFINSGIQVRSQREAGKSEMAGYQVDAGIGYWGDLYDEGRRNKKLIGAQDPAALAKVVKDWEWNEYHIRCEGRRIRSSINGQATFDFTETESSIPLDGKLGIQVHSGGTLLVEIKDLVIEELPATPGAPSWTTASPSRPTTSVEGSTAKTPEEERKLFHLPEGFVAELVASEEQGVAKPITVSWDGRGRLWTMTALEYPVDANENRPEAEALYARGGTDKVFVFDDPSKPGPLTPRVFAEGLALPLGILPDLDGNGALVHYGSQIRRYLDTNKDGKADKFDVILDGFGIQDSHLMPHQFERAPGGWIYVAQGLFNSSKVRRPGGLAFADGSKEKIYDACKLARFRPDGSEFESVSAGPNNIWGLFQTRRGETFLQEANDMGVPVTEFEPGAHYPTNSQDKLRSYAPRIPSSLTTGLGGSGLSGLAVAEDQNSAFAKAYGGDHVIYVANPITGRIQVVTTTAATDRHPEYFIREDFLVSSDPWFRPVSIHFGPDGFLYIVDWYNKVISHNEVPRTHPDRDKTRGRIWRIRPVGVKSPASVDFAKLSGAEMMNQLGGPAARTAAMAWSWLGERITPGAISQLDKIVGNPKATDARRLDALRALELGKSVSPAVFKILATDPSPAIRYQALRAAGELQIDANLFVKLFDKAPEDPNYRVRAALANAVRGHRKASPEMIALVAKLGRAPVEAGGVWETYDREFERYLARWSMETHREQTLQMLKADFPLTQENRLLAILSLAPDQAAALLVAELPALSRQLSAEELSLLGDQLGQAPVMAAMHSLLSDEARRKPALLNLTRLDPKLLANPSLATPVANACDSILAKPTTTEDRGLILKLARLMRLSSLEPKIAAWISAGTPAAEITPTLAALREMGSNRSDLFVSLLDHADETVRGEATAALASAPDLKSIDLLAARWSRLPGALRVIVANGLTSSKEKTAAFAKAAASGAFAELDTATLEKFQTILGAADPSLVTLLKNTAGMFGRVIRISEKLGGVQESPIDLVGPFTVETWIKLDPGVDNGDGLLGKNGGADFNFYDQRLHVYGGAGVGDLIVAERAMVPDVWTHCAVTRDAAGNLRIYLDGELNQEKGRISPEPLTGMHLGATSSGRQGAARFDEFRVWNVARSEEEIRGYFRTRLDSETPPHLVKRLSGEHGGAALAVEMTRDFPQLITAAQATAAAERFARFRAMAEKPGDLLAGRALFQASCMICHQVKGEGRQFGPDLSGVGAMGIQGVLRNILDPNAQLESGYYRHDVSLTDGSLVSGFLVEETKEALTIRPIGADPKVIPLASIANHTIAKRSLMPEGLIEGFSEKQVADLFSYITSLK